MESQQHTSSNTETAIFSDINEGIRLQHAAGIKKARNILFIIGIVMTAGDIILMAVKGFEYYDLPLVFTLDGIILASFIGLGFYTKKKPFTAILIGLIIFLAIQVLNAFLNPASIMKGIFLKIVVISALVQALRGAREIQNLPQGEQ